MNLEHFFSESSTFSLTNKKKSSLVISYFSLYFFNTFCSLSALIQQQIIYIIKFITLKVMQDRDFFFKPYRQRINTMNQHHDSLQQDQYEQPSPNKGQFSHSPSYGNINRPWIQNSSYRQYSPDGNQGEINQYENKNRNKMHTKLAREMHQPVWQHLYNYGLKVQKQRVQEQKQKSNKIDTQCTFQPMIRKNSRYRIPTTSNFLERNYIWQQNKLQKIVKQKQQQVVKDLQNCTFKPQLNNYYKIKTNKYHHLKPSKSKSVLIQDRNKNKTTIQNNRGKEKDRDKERQRKNTNVGFNRQQVGKIKNIIRSQLKRIQL